MYCASPPTIPNASPGILTSITYRGTVTYTCVSGYETSNRVTTTTITCETTGNWEPLPICTSRVQEMLLVHNNDCIQRIVVDCGSPPTIPNGSPGTPTSTTFGGRVSYTCKNRYHVLGLATVTCEASRNWSTRPTCLGE